MSRLAPQQDKVQCRIQLAAFPYEYERIGSCKADALQRRNSLNTSNEAVSYLIRRHVDTRKCNYSHMDYPHPAAPCPIT